MSVEQVIEICRDMLLTGLMLALPALATSLIVGLVVSLFQAVTSLQDQTLSYVPRILIVGLVILVTLGFALQVAVEFTHRMLARAAEVGG